MKSCKWKWIVGLVVAVTAVGAIFYFHLPIVLRDLLRRTLDWISSLGMWGPILFLVIYILACVLFVPGSVLTLGAGALFGVVKGSILVSISATLGATAAFLAGRFLARDWIAKKIVGNPKFTAIDKAVAEEGWKIVGLVRLSPIFPFSLLNYALGLTRVSLRDYVLASWIGTMPGTVMYVYIGSLAHVSAQRPTPVQWVLRAVGLIATVAVTLVLTRIAKRALSSRQVIVTADTKSNS